MKHPSSRALHDYWTRLRGARRAPERAEIEPGAIRHILADSLILELDMPYRSATLRLAGTRICALFGRELRGAPLATLWNGRPADPWPMVEIVAREAVGVVAGLRGATAAGDVLDLELLILPLRHRGRTQDRVLGTLSPFQPPAWLGLRPLVGLETVSLRVLDAGSMPEDVGLDRHPTAGLLSDAVPVEEPPTPANDRVPVRYGHLMVHRGGRP